MMKKKIFVAALAICLVAAIACGTIAYYTASNTKTNKFMTAAYDPDEPDTDPDDIFSIVVEEDPGEDGTPTDNGVNYDDMLPGSTFDKKVTVKNTGDYSAFVRISVTISDKAAWEAILGAGENILATIADVNTTDWELANTKNTDDGGVTYVYNYKAALAKDASTTPLFNKVTIPTTATTAQMAAIDGFTIGIFGESIQSQYTGTYTEALALLDA